MDRHQLDRRDPQRLQIRNLLDDALVRARVLDVAGRRLREAANVGLVDDRLGQAATEMAVALPIELVVNHHALGRTQDTALGRQEISSQGPAIGIDQSGLGVEAVSPRRFMGSVGLKVIKLPRTRSGDEHAPHMPPAVQIGIELDDVGRLGVVHLVVEENAHGRRIAAEDDKLDPSIVYNSAIRERMCKLQRRLPLGHSRRLNGATRVERNIRSIARIGSKRHLFSPMQSQGRFGGRQVGPACPEILPLLRPRSMREMKIQVGGVNPSLIGSLPGKPLKWQSRRDD